MHAELSHDRVIKMFAAWKDRSFVYMALEWAPGVSERQAASQPAVGWGSLQAVAASIPFV